ncbi:hypothetical protein HZC32_03385 [Candidatus Woesearchaeota archaeon]|nr:hypothetical protein [Candidatus Woesearchaeota archaeon]
MPQIILPSIIAKNQRELNSAFRRLEKVVRELHLDVVDGKFAKNNSLNFNFKLSPQFKYNMHLMVKHPEKWIKKYWTKVDLFIPQLEEIKGVSAYIKWMKKGKKKVAFALKPETNINRIKPFLPDCDYLLILTVHPGFYGSRFLPGALKKIAALKKINPKIKVIVDGGMNLVTVKKAARAGADYFVSGSYVTQAERPEERIKKLRLVVR